MILRVFFNVSKNNLSLFSDIILPVFAHFVPNFATNVSVTETFQSEI